MLEARLNNPFCARKDIAMIQDAIDVLVSHPEVDVIEKLIPEENYEESEGDFNTYRPKEPPECLEDLKIHLERSDAIGQRLQPGNSKLLAQIKELLVLSNPEHPLHSPLSILRSPHVKAKYSFVDRKLTTIFDGKKNKPEFLFPPGEGKAPEIRGGISFSNAPLHISALVLEEIKRQCEVEKYKEYHYTRVINGLLNPPLNELSFCLALAKAAKDWGYVKPELTEENLEIVEGWHPILQVMRKKHSPVKQTIKLTPSQRILIISGPNGGGKTTSLRMLGLISLLAQIGSRVPAQAAKIPIFDNFFTHFFVSDKALRMGQLESEVKQFTGIYDEITPQSFLLADELFRGTDPSAGQALFSGTVSQLPKRVRKAIVATHFRKDLEEIASDDSAIKNMQVVWEKAEDDMIPTYKVEDGVSKEEEYGITCAQQAGLAPEIIKAARTARRKTR